MDNVIIKVYGNLYPADAAMLKKLAVPGDAAALNMVQDQPILSLDGSILRLCFEGVYFPMEDFMDELQKKLQPGQQGKFDYFDLEEWRLTRWLVEDGKMGEAKVIPINNAMEKIF